MTEAVAADDMLPTLEPARGWFVFCLVLWLVVILTPVYLPSGRPHGGWNFLWERLGEFPFAAVLTCVVLAASVVAALSTAPLVRALALVPVAAAWVAGTISVDLEFYDPRFGTWTDIAVNGLSSAALILGVSLVAAMAFRLRRGLRGGRPHRWLALGTLMALASVGRDLVRTDLQAWSVVQLGAYVAACAYLVLGLITGIRRSARTRRAVSLGARLALATAPWYFVYEAYQDAQRYADPPPAASWILGGLQQCAHFVVRYLAGTLAVVSWFQWRDPKTADITVFD